MEDLILKIKSNEKVGTDIYHMVLEGDLSSLDDIGEFVNIEIPGYYLRRPISVMEYSKNTIEILYKVLGHGTNDLSKFKAGDALKVLVGLGKPFTLSKAKKPLLVAGGIGVAPMFRTIREYNEKGIRPLMVYGARSKDDIVLLDELKKGADVYVATDDGSLGFHGNVVSALKELKLDYDYYFACGPQIMLKFLSMYDQNGEVSLEARMGCGFGACMGCSIETTNGPKRVCKEGPVFDASEVKF